MKVRTVKSLFLIFVIYIGTLWSWLQYGVNNIFSYWDELLALLFVPLFFVHIKSKKKKEDLEIWGCLILFALIGLLMNIVYNYAPIRLAISDCFLNIKFFMLLYATIFIFRDWNWRQYKRKIKFHLDLLSIILLVLVLLDRLFTLFPRYEVRFGVSSEQLIFAHPTFCASAFFYLLMLRTLFIIDKNILSEIINAGILFSIVITLRFKAIATALFVIAAMLYVSNKNIKKMKWLIITVSVGAVILIAYDQIYGYFFSPYALRFPRGALLKTGIEILKDYFPFGTGFATFGSYLSGVVYSPIYQMYNIQNIPGMTSDNFNAITDQYWPMIAGQTGIIGILLMIIVWYKLYKKMKAFRKISKKQFVVILSCIIYILVSSTSESAVCNPTCMPLGIILGLVYAQLETEKRLAKQNRSEEKSI